MATQPRGKSTSDPHLDEMINSLVDHLAPAHNRDQIFDLLATVAELAGDDARRLDLKITNSALREMRQAFKLFKPFAGRPKVTIFGSARTLTTDPLYEHTMKVARLLSEQGWMVVTGAGPGIMAAGFEGAGVASSIGIDIQLPFEQTANDFIADDPKLVSMKYFFTRKLMLIKESDGFVIMPGGFGTLDEMFELLTLVQTGKAEPQPIVLLDVPGGTYWHTWLHFVEQVKDQRYISPHDDVLFKITDDPQVAADEILGFYRNYHSRRFVGSRLVIRMKVAPTPVELEKLSEAFSDIVADDKGITVTDPLPAEVRDDDALDLKRIVFRFDRIHQARLREMINAINQLGSAPEGHVEPRHYEEKAGG